MGGGNDVRCLALLATAYGNTGRVRDAREVTERALELAERENNSELIRALRTALERFQERN